MLRRLHRKVNVVPVIAKADTLTTHEVKKLKERILADIEEHEIQVRPREREIRENQVPRSSYLNLESMIANITSDLSSKLLKPYCLSLYAGNYFKYFFPTDISIPGL